MPGSDGQSFPTFGCYFCRERWRCSIAIHGYMVFFASLKTLCFFDCGRLYILQNYSKKHTKKCQRLQMKKSTDLRRLMPRDSESYMQSKDIPRCEKFTEPCTWTNHEALVNGISYSNNTNYTAWIPQIIMYTKKFQELPVQYFKVMIDVATCHLYLKRQLGSASHSSGRTWKRLAGSRIDCLTLWPHRNISLSWCFIQSYVTWHHLHVFCLTNLLATLYKFMHVNHVQIYGFILQQDESL